MTDAIEKAEEALALIKQAKVLKKQAKALLQPVLDDLLRQGDAKTLKAIGKLLPDDPWGMRFGVAAHEISQGNVPPGMRPEFQPLDKPTGRVVWSDRAIKPHPGRMGATPRDMASIGTVLGCFTVQGGNYFDIEWAFQRTPGKPPELNREDNIPYYQLAPYPYD